MEQPTFNDPTTEELWWKLKGVVDSRGEFGDPSTEFGVIRKVGLVFTSSKAAMHIT